jgi:plastocyanin
MTTRSRLSNRLDPHHVRMLLSSTMVVLAAGCSAEDFGPDLTVDGTAVRVIDNDFEPADLQVTAGDTVTWTWEGSRDHNVVGDGFQSETQANGTFTHTFDEPGAHSYACTLHSGMRAEIVVTD